MTRLLRLLRHIWSIDACRAALLLFFILDIAFFPCIWGNKTFLASARDAASIMPYGAWEGQHRTPRFPKTLDEGVPGYLTEPWFKLIGKQYLAEKNPPLWNPYQDFGTPLAANMESQPFYPLTALLSLHLTPRTYNWYILLRLFLAGFCMYLFLRFFVSFVPALAGGVASMLAGYYILFITMQQTSVEVMLPAALLTGEWLLRKANYVSAVLFAAVLFLVMVGGMPESAFILLLFVYGYLIARCVFDAELRPKWLRIVTHLAISTVTGLLLSAILLLPFYEYLHLSFNLHQPGNIAGAVPGLGYENLDSSVIGYVFPLLFGPTPNDAFSGIHNYFGIVALFLAAVSVTAIARGRTKDAQLNFLTIFSVLSIVVVLLKRYGFTPVNAIGDLPLFRFISFTKYEELIVSAGAAILCAVGLEQIMRRNVSIGQLRGAFIVTSVIALSGVVWAFPHARVSVGSSRLFTYISDWAIGVGAVCLVGLAVILSKSLDRLPRPVVGLLAFEFLFCYIAPVYYIFNFLPTVASNPYKGAPFVRVLQNATRDNNRIFCRDGVLFPNWSSAFSLPDIRAVGAMHYKKYFDFLHAFLPIPRDATDGELTNRFNGGGDYYQFKDPLSLRLLQLTSVKYIGTAHPYTDPNPLVEQILQQNAGHLLPGKQNNIARQEFFLDGEAREALGEHPPYERLPYRVTVGGPGSDIFYFSYGLNPAVYDKTAGDGVGFTIELQDPSGAIKKMFSRYIDPKHNPAERHWLRGSLDLSAYSGQRITLLFSTDPGPKGDTSYDWAAWSDLHFTPDRTTQPFRLLYAGEAQVYAYDHIVPRAAIYTHADLLESSKEVLSRLSQPSLDVFKEVAIARTDLNGGELAAIEKINASSATAVSAASIRHYESQRVDIDGSTSTPAILVLNDSDFPGWTATLDGHPVHWFSANYIFRALLLPPGKHAIAFRYQPASFRTGVYLAIAGLVGLIGWGLIEARRGRVQIFRRVPLPRRIQTAVPTPLSESAAPRTPAPFQAVDAPRRTNR